jgi:hypothetical protein
VIDFISIILAWIAIPVDFEMPVCIVKEILEAAT